MVCAKRASMDDETEYEPAPEGWVLHPLPFSFAGRAGPFYWREEGAPSVGFFSKPYHGNLGNVVHGGALLTLADMALFAICRDALAGSHAVTVTLNSEFLNPGPIGAFITADGEVVKAGKSILMARGTVCAGDTPLLAFSGVLKRLSRPAPSDSPVLRQR